MLRRILSIETILFSSRVVVVVICSFRTSRFRVSFDKNENRNGGKGAVIDSPVRSDDNLCTLSLPLSDVTARKRDIVRMRGEKASTCACVCTVVCVKQGEQKTISSERRKNSFYLLLELPPRFPLTPPSPPPSDCPECPICHWLNGSLLYTCFKIDNHIFRLSRGDLCRRTLLPICHIQIEFFIKIQFRRKYFFENFENVRSYSHWSFVVLSTLRR